MEESAHIIREEMISREQPAGELCGGPDTYVAIDLETTGLDPKHDKIIEIGAALISGGEVTETFSTLVNPRRELDERIEELTGITVDMVADAPDIGEVIGGVVEFCGDLPLLGHNIIFDYSFLKRAAVNQGLPFEKNGIDTLTLCRRFMPEEERKNLGNASLYYGVKQEGAHRAMADALTAHFLYQAVKKIHFSTMPEAFFCKPLVYKVKKEQPATKKQKEVLRDLLKYHRINVSAQIDYLSRNEVSRMTDKIISQYGRIKRGDKECLTSVIKGQGK